MPEFVMEGRYHAARAESEFVLGFIEALFFTECCMFDRVEWQRADPDDREGYLPRDVGYTDLHPDSLAKIRAFCEAFQRDNAALLAQAYARSDYDETQAGRDLWFTSQGHGVGYWDRKELNIPGAVGTGLSIGQKLSDAARYKEANVWFADHVTYGNAPFVYVEI